MIVSARAQHCGADLGGDGIGDTGGERLLQARGRTEMMEEIGVGPPDPRRNRLQRDRLRPCLEQQRAGGFQRGVA